LAVKKKKEPLERKKKKEPSEVKRARKRRPCRCCTRVSRSKSQHQLPSHQHLDQQRHHGRVTAEAEVC
jgi:hypothetical protein